MINSADYLIIGNSAAAINAAEAIRKTDRTASLLLLTEEKYVSYSKPLISYYLAGKLPLEKIFYRSPEFYKKNGISLHTDTKIIGMDTQKKELYSSGGRKYRYKKLLIASGGKPLVPPIKVCGGSALDEEISRLEGIYTLANLEDAIKIKEYIIKNEIKEATILGAGLIGLKAAEACSGLGLKIRIIDLSDRILSANFDQKASELMEERIREKGCLVNTSSTINKIIIQKNTLQKIVIDDRETGCRLLIVAVGIKPDLSFVDRGIVYCKDGIKVSQTMETTAKDVFASGDIVNAKDMLTGRDANIAIWPLAVNQGKVAGSNMAGKKEVYEGGFLMNSIEIMGLASISMGLSMCSPGYDIKTLTKEGPERYSYRKIVLRDDRVIGVIMLANIERAGIYAGLIKNQIDIRGIEEHIIKEDFGLIQLPADYKKHLVTGEGIEV